MNWQSIAFSIQQGRGRKILGWLAVLVVVPVFSLYLTWKRESGPENEWIIENGLIAKSVARGEGFQTPVRYPRAINKLGDHYKSDHFVSPELWHAPGYPAALGAAFKLAGDEGMDWMFADPEPSEQVTYPFFRADRYWLFVNLVFFWLVLVLTWFLAWRIFNPLIAGISALALFVTASEWTTLVRLDSSLWISLLMLVFMHLGLSLTDRLSRDSRYWILFAFLLGLAGTGLVLSRYAAMLVVLGFIISIPILFGNFRKRALLASGIVLITMIIGMFPWLIRNMEFAHHPLGLAGETISYRVGDPTAEPGKFKTTFNAEAPPLSIPKILNKGLTGWRETIQENIWRFGGLWFLPLFMLSLLWRFRDTRVNLFRAGFLASVFPFILLEPFFASGELETPAVFYFAPIIIVFGCGFFQVLTKSLLPDSMLKRGIVWVVIIGLQGFPLLHLSAEPRRLPFQYPPYWPSVLVQVNEFKERYYGSKKALVADVPAGFCWYSGSSAWAQPDSYGDFSRINLYEAVTVQFFSPALMNKPFLSELRLMGKEEVQNVPSKRHWGAVYQGIVEDDLPSFYPLQGIRSLHHNVFVTFQLRR